MAKSRGAPTMSAFGSSGVIMDRAMGLAYLFALIVGAGILTFQLFAGHQGDDGDHGDGDDGHHGDHKGDGKAIELDGGFVALFMSTRFWIFAALGFGLSGTLLTYLLGGSFLLTLITAVALGLGSGLTAAASFRALRRASAGTANAASAVGRLARVLVPIEAGKTGQVRIDLEGQTLDLMARTDEGRLERGETVVVEEVDGHLATVAAVPDELKNDG
jgi:membrane protein implicated in regulation of membrane protease activity